MAEFIAHFWEYLSKTGIYWWGALGLLATMERYLERLLPALWKAKIDPWITPRKRRDMLILFALIAFVIGNFEAFDYERSAKEQATTRASKAVLDPTELYQTNVPVAMVANPESDAANGLLRFPVVTASRELDMAKEFEFQDWILACSGREEAIMSFGAMRQINYGNFICKIQGPR